METPEIIYLQIEDDEGNKLPEGATWCVDKIFDTDVEYVRAVGAYCPACGYPLPRHKAWCKRAT